MVEDPKVEDWHSEVKKMRGKIQEIESDLDDLERSIRAAVAISHRPQNRMQKK